MFKCVICFRYIYIYIYIVCLLHVHVSATHLWPYSGRRIVNDISQMIYHKWYITNALRTNSNAKITSFLICDLKYELDIKLCAKFKWGMLCAAEGEVIRYRPDVAQRVGRGIALVFHDRGTRRGWVISSTPRPHFTPGKDSVPILQNVVWASGLVWTGRKSRPHRDSIPDHPAHSSVTILTELPSPCSVLLVCSISPSWNERSVCVCVCVRARAHVHVCVCVCGDY